MIEKYLLSEQALPTIPVPHDFVIERIALENDCLVFTFEDGISYHDAAKRLRPGARSLVMRIHLLEEKSFALYRWKHEKHKRGFLLKKRKKLLELTKSKGDVSYLYHYIAYNSIIVKLWADSTFYLLEIDSDCVDFDWLE